LQKLESGGKCYDWAANALYCLSLDKFLTHSLLTRRLFTTWMLLAFCAFLLVFTKISWNQVGLLVELGSLIVSLLNFGKEQLLES